VEVEIAGLAERIALHPDRHHRNVGNLIDGIIDIPMGDATH
jgi:hypothetical protein